MPEMFNRLHIKLIAQRSRGLGETCENERNAIALLVAVALGEEAIQAFGWSRDGRRRIERRGTSGFGTAVAVRIAGKW